MTEGKKHLRKMTIMPNKGKMKSSKGFSMCKCNLKFGVYRACFRTINIIISILNKLMQSEFPLKNTLYTEICFFKSP